MMSQQNRPTAPPSSCDSDPPAVLPPSYQKIHDRGGNPGGEQGGNGRASYNEEETTKMCRICLEEDSPETMIAPCKCKGGSKWVHRDCLDEWRTNERDRAFSKCTECLFEYCMQPVYGHGDGSDSNEGASQQKRQQQQRFQFYWKLSRDVCLGTMLLQIVIVALAVLIWICDAHHQLPSKWLPTFQSHPASLYYLLGWMLLLILMGLYGSVVLCFNGCSISRSIPQTGPPTGGNSRIPGATMEDDLARGLGAESTTEYYRRARHRRQRYYHRQQQRQGRYHDDCDCCWYGYYGCYDCHPYYAYNTGNHCCCCCCSCEDGGTANNGQADCDCCHGCGFSSNDSNDCGGDGAHILLIALLVVAVVLAVVGFFVGIVITVIAFQRVIQRHIHLVQKRELVKEFIVMDMKDYDLDQPLPTAPCEEDVEAVAIASARVVPSAPIEPLPAKDAKMLKELGLMD